MPTIRELREQKGWSLEELGRRAGVALQTVYRAERGATVNKNTLRHIAQALGVQIEELEFENRGQRGG